MTEKYISVREWAEERLKDSEFKAAYDALEDEFALAGSRASRFASYMLGGSAE